MSCVHIGVLQGKLRSKSIKSFGEHYEKKVKKYRHSQTVNVASLKRTGGQSTHTHTDSQAPLDRQCTHRQACSGCVICASVCMCVGKKLKNINKLAFPKNKYEKIRISIFMTFS